MDSSIQDTLKRYVQDLLLDQGDAAEIGVDDDLLSSGLDSMSLIGLITFIEQTFDVHVPPEDVTIESFSTIGNIATYLASRDGAND